MLTYWFLIDTKPLCLLTGITQINFVCHSLRSKPFHVVGEQREAEERVFRSFGRTKNGART